MPSPEHMWPDADDTTSYLVAMPADDWAEWKDSVPRSTPLYERIHTLTQIDATLAGDVDLEAMQLLRLKFERIAERSRTARQALDEGDTGKARAELDKIGEIASDLLE